MSEKNRSEKTYPLQAHAGDLPSRLGTQYPAPHDEPCLKREKTALGDRVGLSQFGVNLLVLPPQSWSAQRHWHQNEDEFVYILEGEVVLITDEGENILRAGEIAGFPAGAENGHHLVNKSQAVAKILEVGTRAQSETASYPDVDLKAEGGDAGYRFFHKNGEPYE